MKKSELSRLLSLLKASGKFRNDGHGHLYFYEDEPMGIWKALAKEVAFQVIEGVLMNEGLLHSDVVSLYTELLYSKYFAEQKLAEPPDELLVAVENGVFNVKTKILGKKDSQLYLRHGLHISYRPDAKLHDAPTWDRFMRRSMELPNGINISAHPKVVRLQTSMGYTITPLRGAKKAPVLIGATNSGKSVVLNLLARAVGDENSISLGLPDIYDRFRTDFLGHRQAILVHEVPGKPIKRLDFLKKFIAGEPLISEAKGRQPVEIRTYGKPIMAANVLPVLAEVDQGGAFAARLLATVFTKREIPESERDPELIEKLWAERDVIFSLALDAASVLCTNKMQFPEEPEGDFLVAQYKHDSDAVPRFVEDCCEESGDDALPLGECFDAFITYCHANCLDNGATMTRTIFRNQVAQLGFLFKKQRTPGFTNPVSCILGLKWRKGATSLCEQQKMVESPQTSVPNAKKN